MLAQKPWLRVTLFVAAAAIILMAVGAFSYNLGAQNAAGFIPRVAQLDRTDFDGPARGGRAGHSDGRQTAAQLFTRNSQLSSSWFSSPLAWLLRAAIGAAFLGMLVLGTVAFFRTGGWRPAPAAAEVVEAPPKKTAKKAK